MLISIDGLAVAIALPAIQEGFGAPAVDGQWVLTAYGSLDLVAFVVTVAGASAMSRRSPQGLLASAFLASTLALLWLARAPDDAVYAGDVLVPLVVLGGSLPLAFVVLTQQALEEVRPDERGMASGISETANHLFGGAIGVALYATVIAAAGGYGPAFLVAAGLAACGLAVARIAPRGAPAARDTLGG